MCGSQSEIQIPLWPCCFHFRRDAKSGARPSPIGVITGLKLGGSGFPASRLSSGLGSNVSMWLGPPSMNRKITLRAVLRCRQGTFPGCTRLTWFRPCLKLPLRASPAVPARQSPYRPASTIRGALTAGFDESTSEQPPHRHSAFDLKFLIAENHPARPSQRTEIHLNLSIT